MSEADQREAGKTRVTRCPPRSFARQQSKSDRGTDLDEVTAFAWHGPTPISSTPELFDLAVLAYLEDRPSAVAAERAGTAGTALTPPDRDSWYPATLGIGVGSLAGSVALLALDRCRATWKAGRQLKPALPSYTGPTVAKF